MSRTLSVALGVCGCLGVIGFGSTASAQWPGNPCGCAQPVVQACYRTVPVTEYREHRQTVHRPVVETNYVEQKVTTYKPVTETRTATVPTVSYENVTECRTVYRDCGYWTTRYERVPKVHPCQYDNRPDVFGWLNRTGFMVRQAMTPSVIARREYVPNVVAYEVPITRRVAHRGTKEVTYNVTRMVPQTTTRKVPVRTVRYVPEEVVTKRPVTVLRRVPIGSSIAYARSGNDNTPQTALQPEPDPVGGPEAPSSGRTADERNKEPKEPPEKFEQKSSRLDAEPGQAGGSSSPRPSASGTAVASRPSGTDVQRVQSTPPSIVRVNRFSSPRRTSTGPSLISPSISIAGSER